MRKKLFLLALTLATTAGAYLSTSRSAEAACSGTAAPTRRRGA